MVRERKRRRQRERERWKQLEMLETVSTSRNAFQLTAAQGLIQLISPSPSPLNGHTHKCRLRRLRLGFWALAANCFAGLAAVKGIWGRLRVEIAVAVGVGVRVKKSERQLELRQFFVVRKK